MVNVKQRQISPEYKQKPVRSYVIRSGRITEGQLNALENYASEYRLSLFDGAPATWAEVFQRDAPRVLEIGFGMGDSLLAMAINEPDKDFIGIEVHLPGVGRLICNAAARKVRNLKIYLADAVDVLDDCISVQSLSRVQIYFPDPWPKKKHRKRRLIQAPLVEKICDRLMVNGVLHLTTDWQPYAEQMLAVLETVPGLQNMATEGEYSHRPAYRPETKFERRGIKLGHGVWDLIYQRTA